MCFECLEHCSQHRLEVADTSLKTIKPHGRLYAAFEWTVTGEPNAYSDGVVNLAITQTGGSVDLSLTPLYTKFEGDLFTVRIS